MDTTSHDESRLHRIETRLDRMERAIGELLDAQRRRAEWFEEMTPIAREALGALSERLEHMEERGYFTFGREALRVLDRVVRSYSEEDVRALGDHIVSILDTVRHVTQPHVLRVANEAVEAFERPDVEPVGVLGMLRSSRDEDIRRGMAVILELLRHVGRAAERASEGTSSPRPTLRSRPPVAGASQSSQPGAAGSEKQVERNEASHARPRDTAPEPQPAEEGEGWRLDDDGHLADPSEWDREFAEAMALHLGLGELSEAQWRVVEWAREEWRKKGAAPNIRRITTGMGIETRELYRLFPKAPARTIARIAGIPKPVGCL